MANTVYAYLQTHLQVY